MRSVKYLFRQNRESLTTRRHWATGLVHPCTYESSNVCYGCKPGFIILLHIRYIQGVRKLSDQTSGNDRVVKHKQTISIKCTILFISCVAFRVDVLVCFLQHILYLKILFIVTLKLGTILPRQRTFLKNYKILNFQNGGKLNYGKYLVSLTVTIICHSCHF